MAKRNTLTDELMTLPPVERSTNWFSRLPKEQQGEIKDAAVAWSEGGPLKERFPCKVHLARAIIAKRGLKVKENQVVEAITELTNGAH